MEEREYKLGKELGLTAVRPEHHQQKEEKVESILMEINDVIYFWSYRYLNCKARDYVLKQFEVMGNKMKDAEQTERVSDILQQLRKNYKILRSYSPEKDGVPNKDSLEVYTKTVNRQVALYVKAKEEHEGDIPDNLVLKMLQENELIYQLFVIPFFNQKLGVTLSVKKFADMQNELLRHLGDKYRKNDGLW